jgi:ribosome-binding protein aMBF1 (putative translation factor)
MGKRGDHMVLNEVLKEARIKAGLSQRQLAEKLGVKYQLIQQYEYGKLIPSTKRFLQLARILDINLQEFLLNCEIK